MLPDILTKINNRNQFPYIISIVGAGGKTSTAYWLANAFKSLGYHVLLTTTTKMYLPHPCDIDHFINASEIHTPINGSLSQIINNIFKKNVIDSNTQGSICFLYQHLLLAENNQAKVQGIGSDLVTELKNNSPFSVIIIEADGAKKLPIKCPNSHEPCLPQVSNTVICVMSSEVLLIPICKSSIHRWQTFSHIGQCHQGQILDYQVLEKIIHHKNGSYKNAPKSATHILLFNKFDLVTDKKSIVNLATKITQSSAIIDEIWCASMNTASPIKHIIKPVKANA